ncbi:heme-binding-like protein At3g10130, chloroplastic isoform X1 [Zingiber officinale]|uniref:heme-binding-like protein At3g10130, chloroplastic isoform X1 n=1 Tax=Zingiber officinale TaxID=94328 RepID=UPI001C4AFB46|nr:heme-binding-like protein At3g10130, chloroplastic isoform X1 [Zingiber officinale]
MATLWKPPYPITVSRSPGHRRRSCSGPSTTLKASAEGRDDAPCRTTSAWGTRFSLVLALASQASSVSRRVLVELATETAKYALPRRNFEARNLEEALMSVPDLETVKFRVLKRTEEYEIREVEVLLHQQLAVGFLDSLKLGKTGFDFNGASQSFNVLASYLFGKNIANEQMEMSTPVYTRKSQSDGETMDMTTPVITKKSPNGDKWTMSFVMPSKYGSNLPVPKDQSVNIKEVPRKILAVTAFSGFVTDEDVRRRESKLREDLKRETDFQLKVGASVEVAQFNPPFTLPFTRRNEIAIEVERKI